MKSATPQADKKMANESIVSLPPSLEDPVVVRRVLSKIIEQLDIVTGSRSSESANYVTQKTLKSAIELLEKAILTVAKDSTYSGVTLDQQLLDDLNIATGANASSIDQLKMEVEEVEAAVETKLEWKGAWVAGSYLKNNVVKDAGITWVALVSTAGIPGTSADWESMV